MIRQRKPIARVSERQKKRLREYTKVKRRYLREHPLCEMCSVRKADSLHHCRGRAGSLLSDARYFKALCEPCHDWIHANPQKARQAGLLAHFGKWNTP